MLLLTIFTGNADFKQIREINGRNAKNRVKCFRDIKESPGKGTEVTDEYFIVYREQQRPKVVKNLNRDQVDALHSSGATCFEVILPTRFQVADALKDYQERGK